MAELIVTCMMIVVINRRRGLQTREREVENVGYISINCSSQLPTVRLDYDHIHSSCGNKAGRSLWSFASFKTQSIQHENNKAFHCLPCSAHVLPCGRASRGYLNRHSMLLPDSAAPLLRALPPAPHHLQRAVCNNMIDDYDVNTAHMRVNEPWHY